jgi:hypothetical protein
MQIWFVKKYWPFLITYAVEEYLKEVLDAFKRDETCASGQLAAVCGASCLCETVFSQMGKAASLQVFYEDMALGISELEGLSFGAEDVIKFRTIMAKRVAELTDEDMEIYANQEVGTIEFLGVTMAMKGVSLNETWCRHLRAQLKTAALASGCLEFMPWEMHLYEDDIIPNAPQTLRIPDSVLEDMHDARGLMMSHIKADACTDLASMLSTLDKHYKEYILMDPTIDLEYEFLEKHAQGLMH